jgi:hypothetical protein
MGKHGDVGLLCRRALAVAAHGAATSEHSGQRNRRNKFCEFHFFPFLFGYRQQGSGSWQPRTHPFSIAAYLTIYRASFIAEKKTAKYDPEKMSESEPHHYAPLTF